MIVYGFFYNNDICTSSDELVSLHRTRRAAEDAMNAAKEEYILHAALVGRELWIVEELEVEE